MSKNVIFDEGNFYTKEVSEILDNDLIDKNNDWIDGLYDDVTVVEDDDEMIYLSSSSTSLKDILDLTENNENSSNINVISSDISPHIDIRSSH